jgi:SAM-dependent methyltransferase
LSSPPAALPAETRADILATLALLRSHTAQGRWGERHALLWASGEKIRTYLHSFGFPGADNRFIEHYVNDALARFFNTLDLMAVPAVPAGPRDRVLEIGGNPYLFTLLLRRFYDFDLAITNFFSQSVYEVAVAPGQQTLESAAFGERHDFDFLTVNIELSEYPYAAESFDTVLFCEVLEHIVVDPFACFPKLFAILKPGGRLVITTPNAVRLINFAHMLAGRNFFDRYHPQNGIYGRHNREFTLSELVALLPGFGFEIEVAKTLDRYNYDFIPMTVDSYDARETLPWKPAQLMEALKQAGGNTADRGDNLYVVARKPLA